MVSIIQISVASAQHPTQNGAMGDDARQYETPVILVSAGMGHGTILLAPDGCHEDNVHV
jgi:hypothetical protein